MVGRMGRRVLLILPDLPNPQILLSCPFAPKTPDGDTAMKPEHGATCALMPARSPARSIAVPVLIRVPALSTPSRRAGRPRPRRRRRLRWEVRALGWTALIGMVATLGLMTWGGSRRPGVAQVVGLDREGFEAPPVVSLSSAIEPATPLGYRESGGGGAVILPGYIVPNDAAEEPSHAGN